MAEDNGASTPKQGDDPKEGTQPWTLREIAGKTVWDWIQLTGVLALPVVIAVGGCAFAAGQDNRQQRLEEQRAKDEQAVAEERAQDEALQAYLDEMTELVLDRKLLKAEPGDSVYTLAQARTSTAILGLDAEHNESVTNFLSNSGLVVRSEVSGEAPPRLLRGIKLSQATLSDAYLPGADLVNTRLNGADLSGALLFDADLTVADLREADLREANLITANLNGTDLREADLSGADLKGARGWTAEALSAAKHIEGAIMPDGQPLKSTHNPEGPTIEEWLKEKKARKEGE